MTYSNKIVSLHLEECKYGCPNQEKCYLRKRVNVANPQPFPTNFREAMLTQGFVLHEALCDTPNAFYLDLLKRFKNYNITVSINDLYPWTIKNILKYKEQVQVSIYTLEDAKCYSGQKLFLIYDMASYQTAKFIFKSTELKNLHFNVDKDCTSSAIVFLSDPCRNITMDSCLSSWIINGECPYTTNYIDISYDWTLRKCPFAKDGISIPKDLITNHNYIDLFNLEPTSCECSYSEKFRRKLNG